MRNDEVFWVSVAVTNDAEREVAGFEPYPVRLCYHWVDAITGEVVVFNGHRTDLFPSVGPSETSTLDMLVVAPPMPGEFTLEITFVQERVCWFDQVAPGNGRGYQVTVRA